MIEMALEDCIWLDDVVKLRLENKFVLGDDVIFMLGVVLEVVVGYDDTITLREELKFVVVGDVIVMLAVEQVAKGNDQVPKSKKGLDRSGVLVASSHIDRFFTSFFQVF